MSSPAARDTAFEASPVPHWSFGVAGAMIVTGKLSVVDPSAGAVIWTVGGVIGAIIVFGLREYLSTLVPWWQYVLGGVYVLTILYLPTGLMGIPERIRRRRPSSATAEQPKKLAPGTS